MHILIVYVHPSETSFTKMMKDEFIKGLVQKGHTYEVSDLYKKQFTTDLSEEEYLREAFFRHETPVSKEVQKEQELINNCDVITFIYPVFWSEAPAKLVGWFDRVWSYGFAYGDNRTMKILDKALFLCSAGSTMDKLEETGLLHSMKNIMTTDRIYDRAKESEMHIFDGTSRSNNELRISNMEVHLKRAYEIGNSL